MSRPTTLLLSLVLLAPAVVACGAEASLKQPVSTRSVTNELLRAARATREGWLTHGRDWTNQRYVPLAEINQETVRGLEKLWRHDPGQLFRRSVRNESTPIVVDDLLIYTDLKDLVIAVDARNGRERWRYQPQLRPAALCCGVVNRGVAVYGDKVYLATLDARVIALDRSNGSVVWDISAAEPAEGYSFTMAPLVADGKIIVGSSGGEFGIRGFVDAYEPETGRQLWRFWTIPSPEEGGWITATGAGRRRRGAAPARHRGREARQCPVCRGVAEGRRTGLVHPGLRPRARTPHRRDWQPVPGERGGAAR